MSGVVYQFGATPLPQHAASWQLAAAARKLEVRTPGGVFDPYRGAVADIELPFPVTVRALALAPSAALNVTLAAKAAELGVALDGYRGLVGRRDRLWLDPYDSAQVDRWCWARLSDVNYTGSVKDRIWQEVDLVFRGLCGWQGHSYGGAWNLDSGYLFDSGLYLDSGGAVALAMNPTTLTLPNAGNRTVTNAGVALKAGDGPITSARLQGPGTDWIWRGTLAAGKTLIVDCGAKAVLNDGADAYVGFELNAGHASRHWLALAPGDNAVTLSVDNIGEFVAATAQITYADGWI